MVPLKPLSSKFLFSHPMIMKSLVGQKHLPFVLKALATQCMQKPLAISMVQTDVSHSEYATYISSKNELTSFLGMFSFLHFSQDKGYWEQSWKWFCTNNICFNKLWQILCWITHWMFEHMPWNFSKILSERKKRNSTRPLQQRFQRIERKKLKGYNLLTARLRAYAIMVERVLRFTVM